ncbi:MAG: hypothetical protein J4215_06350, partial [Candidatus Diapherotrites archaeon]|nr:hypothetical protein [Candidatus Diapherotrites archaeon]
LFEPAGGGSTSVSCGNNICEVDENASVCPLDCPNVCGDRACTHTENNFSCPFDCAIGCGNGICDARESKQTCPTDCDPTGGGIIDVNINRPDGSENPITVPLIPQNKACESDSDCGVSTSCSISRCIRNQCYGGRRRTVRHWKRVQARCLFKDFTAIRTGFGIRSDFMGLN